MSAARIRLEAVLEDIGPLAIAVSGGVDSLTLASLAGLVLSPEAVVGLHAQSAAVPAEATQRVRAQSASEGWALRVIDAGELVDPAYRANPVNRCFFCKTNLYGAIRRMTDRPIVSGTNLDDLGEYRPGLDAARDHGVRHPYVEAGIDKASVRALARELGLGGVAELPAAPCLSSRVETGIRIERETLHFIHGIERLVVGRLGPGRADLAVRCRVRKTSVVIELDPVSWGALDEADRSSLQQRIANEAPPRLAGLIISFAPYRTGSAFLRGSAGDRA